MIQEYSIIDKTNDVLSTNARFFNEAIQEWCDKAKFIKISFESLKNYVDDLQAFLEMLYQIKKTGILSDTKRDTFLELLVQKGNSFNEFYSGQLDYFKAVCEFNLNGLEEDDIKCIFSKLEYNLFTEDKSQYIKKISEKVDEFKENQGKIKLKNLWKQKTGTDTPEEWSNKYRTPILCIVPMTEELNAKNVFDTINRGTADKKLVDEAIHYLEQATFLKIWLTAIRLTSHLKMEWLNNMELF